MPHDHVTFGLATIGFALLATDAARRWRGDRSATLTAAVAAVVVAHVLCVWALRFDWSAAAMWNKSPAAFEMFHAALALLLSALVVREPWRSRAVIAAFAVVCTGALPAPFRYAELALLRWPLLAVAATAVAAAVRARRGVTADRPSR